MQWIKITMRQFLDEPLWFRLLILISLLLSILLSASSNAYYQSGAKLAAAIFFAAYGIRLRRNRVTSLILYALGVLCVYLSWHKFALAHL